jgi:hypothetical protein
VSLAKPVHGHSQIPLPDCFQLFLASVNKMEHFAGCMKAAAMAGEAKKLDKTADILGSPKTFFRRVARMSLESIQLLRKRSIVHAVTHCIRCCELIRLNNGAYKWHSALTLHHGVDATSMPLKSYHWLWRAIWAAPEKRTAGTRQKILPARRVWPYRPVPVV